MCPKYETPIEVEDEEPGAAPREGVVRSLGMTPRRLADGRWNVSAPWLDGSVTADTWPEAYWAAVKRKAR